MIDDTRRALRRQGVVGAVRRHDTAKLFDWLMTTLSYQGIADRVARDYLDRHGSVTWQDIKTSLEQAPTCPKLDGYWRFFDCRYEKGRNTCAEPNHRLACPLPHHKLRNGRLNQTAYSLFLFLRDVAGGDLVQWIDDQLAQCGQLSDAGSLVAARQQLIEPLRQVYGISDKVLSMALSSLLLGASSRRHQWLAVGASFVVVDSLVHNFLHRSGILRRFHADHAYGPRCYGHDGCADLLQWLATYIDARTFNPSFPRAFPRFVQLAIWRYCAQDGLDICNGNRIRDTEKCDNGHCQLRNCCDRDVLHRSIRKQRILAA